MLIFMFFELSKKSECGLHKPVETFLGVFRQYPGKLTNSHGHKTIIEGPNLFGPKNSFHPPPHKNASFKSLKNQN